MIKETFFEVCSHYSEDSKLIQSLWKEIESAYKGSRRHYHTLEHLENLHQLLTEVKNHILNWDVIIFALVYHDIVYDLLSRNNEIKSAKIAEARLSRLNVPGEAIQLIKSIIESTKEHNVSPDSDCNLFTDADLSVLGSPPEVYKNYCAQIRKEYAMVPDILYRRGRKKVIQHFYDMDNIYKTAVFGEKFERKARENLLNELKTLS